MHLPRLLSSSKFLMRLLFDCILGKFRSVLAPRRKPQRGAPLARMAGFRATCTRGTAQDARPSAQFLEKRQARCRARPAVRQGSPTRSRQIVRAWLRQMYVQSGADPPLGVHMISVISSTPEARRTSFPRSKSCDPAAGPAADDPDPAKADFQCAAQRRRQPPHVTLGFRGRFW